jgi:hypothetical protein
LPVLVGDRFNSVLSNGENRLRDALERFVQDLTADEAQKRSRHRNLESNQAVA